MTDVSYTVGSITVVETVRRLKVRRHLSRCRVPRNRSLLVRVGALESPRNDVSVDIV